MPVSLFPARILPRCALAALLLASIVPARADDPDFLSLPAAQTARAAEALMLDVARGDALLVAVGDRGIALRSEDGGQHWQQAKTPVSVVLTTVTLLDDANGWAAGHDGAILRTRDGGRSWEKRFDGRQSATMALHAAQRRQQEVQAQSDALNASDVASDEERTAAEDALMAAEDAVADAESGAEFGPSRPFLDLWFRSPDEGIAVGAFGQVVRTRDGGDTWEYLGDRFDNPEGFHFNAISAIPSGTLLVSGEGGRVFASFDGGDRWVARPTDYNGQLYGALAVPLSTGVERWIAFGFGGHAFVSDDQGEHWSPLDGTDRVALVAGLARADGSVWLLGRDGSLFAGDANSTSEWALHRIGPPRAAAFAAFTTTPQGRLALAGIRGVVLADAPNGDAGTSEAAR